MSGTQSGTRKPFTSKPKFRFCAGISTYSNARGLKRTLASLQNKTDLNIVIHGRYPHFYPPDPHSLDDTKAVCSQFANTILVDLPRATLEPMKRNKYLQLSKGYDFLLIIDDDEYIADAHWAYFKRQCQKAVDKWKGEHIFNIRFQEVYGWNAGARPRLWYKPWEVRYVHKHYWWRVGSRLFKGDAGIATVDGIMIVHDKSLRTEEFTKSIQRCEQRQWRYEDRKNP